MRLKRLPILLLLLSTLLLTATGDNPPPAPTSDTTRAALSAALTRRLQAAREARALTLLLFTPEIDSHFVSPDGTMAVLWLALRDDAGRQLATEPGLALALRSGADWRVLLPGDPGWEDALAALPAGMLPLEQSPAPAGAAAAPSLSAAAALTGYYLPYAAGTARWLEGSISHFQSIPALGYPSCAQEFCQYAYDFTDAGHFPLLASKDGTVIDSRDSCPDGGTACTNFILLRGTGDLAYQIYLHMARGTIPDKLTPGRLVRRGEYLGDTDDTGYSTSQHVHFMVTNSVWVGGDGYYWGRSVKIAFADVGINNGIPRNCYEVTHFPIYDGAADCLGDKADPRNPANDWFVSGNVGAYPPTGTFTRPASGATVLTGSSPLLDVTATASDDVRITAVRMMAKLGGQWVEVGPKVTQAAQPGTYDWDVDVCALGPLNGALEVGLRAWDYEGNVAGPLAARIIQVDNACPPPTSQLKPAESFASTAVRLSWDAASAGAGLTTFELQWRLEPGAWDASNTLTLAGDQRSTWFTGQPGGSYAFRLRALDGNHQPEAWPAGDAAETSAILPATCTPDAFEPDDDVTQARALIPGVRVQRNLCGAANPDWFGVDITTAGSYLITGLSQNGGAAVRITLYAEDGVTVLASSAAAGVGQHAALRYTAAPGRYFIQFTPLANNLFGTDAVYSAAVYASKEIFLPLGMW
jgi:hypothetical protein